MQNFNQILHHFHKLPTKLWNFWQNPFLVISMKTESHTDKQRDNSQLNFSRNHRLNQQVCLQLQTDDRLYKTNANFCANGNTRYTITRQKWSKREKRHFPIRKWTNYTSNKQTHTQVSCRQWGTSLAGTPGTCASCTYQSHIHYRTCTGTRHSSLCSGGRNLSTNE